MKASKVGQYVAKLSERQNASGVAGVDRGIVSLANEIYDMWAAAASGKSTAAAGSASSSSSSSSAGAGADGKKEKDREKEREKDKGSDAKRQRREAPSSSSGASGVFPGRSSDPLYHDHTCSHAEVAERRRIESQRLHDSECAPRLAYQLRKAVLASHNAEQRAPKHLCRKNDSALLILAKIGVKLSCSTSDVKV